MTTEQWWILGTGIAALLALPGLGFAAMSTNPPFTIPKWVPKIFFALSIAVVSGEGFYFWSMSILSQIIAVVGAIGLLTYLSWPLLKRACAKNELPNVIEIKAGVTTRSESLTDTLTRMHRRLVNLQDKKFERTKPSYSQIEKAMPMLADRMGIVKREDWPVYVRNLKSKIRRVLPHRLALRGSIKQQYIKWTKWKEDVRYAAESVANEVKTELLKSKEWTWKDGVKISDWIDGDHWGVQGIRDGDQQWRADFESIGHYLKKDTKLRELITEHIEISRFYNNACLLARYSKRLPKTLFLITLHEELVGSPISPVKAEIYLSELLGKIDKQLAEITSPLFIVTPIQDADLCMLEVKNNREVADFQAQIRIVKDTTGYNSGKLYLGFWEFAKGCQARIGNIDRIQIACIQTQTPPRLELYYGDKSSNQAQSWRSTSWTITEPPTPKPEYILNVTITSMPSLGKFTRDYKLSLAGLEEITPTLTSDKEDSEN